MPFTWNPNDVYDPDEIRRRQALTGLGISEENTGQPSQYAMSPEEQQDNEAYSPGGASSAPASTEAANRYREALGAMPRREDYQPSKLRRIGAAIAGGLAGMRDARSGVEVATGIRDMPYNQAQQAWAGNVNRGAMEMGLEKDLNAQEVARRNATSNEQRAAAAEASARATEHWRQTQESKLPTHEQNLELARARIAPPRPTGFQEYQTNPDLYGRYQQGQRGPVDTQESKLARIHATGNERMRAVGAQIAGRAANRKAAAPKFASPGDMERAEQMATEQVARTKPGYDRFLITDKNGKSRPASVDELTRKHWWRSDETPSPTDMLEYNDFINKVKQAQSHIMGQIRTPNADQNGQDDEDLFDLQYNDEEDQ